MTAIQSALTQIMTIVSGVSGIRQAPTYPRETQNVYPYSIALVESMDIHAGAIGTKRELLNIRVDVCLDRATDINRSIETLSGLVDTVSAALIGQVSGTGQRFGNTISTFDNLRVRLISEDFAGVPCVGYSFIMENVKILVSL